MGVYNNSNIISTNSYNKEYIDNQINNINEDLSNKVNKSTNIAGYGITDSINYSNITNCVVETPDNINLTLSKEGELNLKAGSIVYFPNGFESDGVTKKIDTITIQEDVIRSDFGTGNEVFILTYIPETNTISVCLKNDVFSGNTIPSSNQYLFYDLTQNKIYDQLDNYKTLPIAIITKENGKIVKINDVFNGVGFIGSTIFMIPGVSYFCGSGINSNGLYENVNITNNQILFYTFSENTNGIVNIFYDGTELIQCNNFYNQLYFPDKSSENDILYNEQENKYYIYKLNKWENIIGCFCTICSVSEYKISNISVRYILRAVDYDECNKLLHINNVGREMISLLSAASTKCIDLELLASESTYTAPADGYFTIRKKTVNPNEYIAMINMSNNININNFGTDVEGMLVRIFLPVKSGDKMFLRYTASGETEMFRFVYKVGSYN